MPSRIVFASLISLSVASLAVAQGHSLFNESLVGVVNTSISGYIGTIAFDYNGDGLPSSASASASFGGMKRDGTDGGTLDFSGSCDTSTQYGALHVYAANTVTNSFYNADNPIYYDDRDNTFHPEGIPDSLTSLCFAGFSDTLQFGGIALQGGYQARYVFRVDGTNTGDIGDYGLSAASAGLSVNVGSDSDGVGFYGAAVNRIWGTKGFAVDGQTPQKIDVQFSSQVVFNTYQYDDGTNLTGTSDFRSTASLTGIALYDPTTNRYVPTSEWSVVSESGTQYAQIYPVPEPAGLFSLAGVAILMVRRRKRA